MEPTAGFHDLIAKLVFPTPHGLFNNSIPFDAPDHVLNPDANPGNRLILRFLFGRQCVAFGFFWGCLMVTPSIATP